MLCSVNRTLTHPAKPKITDSSTKYYGQKEIHVVSHYNQHEGVRNGNLHQVQCSLNEVHTVQHVLTVNDKSVANIKKKFVDFNR